MAIYTYRCGKCGREEEVVQSISSYCVSPNIPDCDCPTRDAIRESIETGRPHIDVLVTIQMERRLTSPLLTFDTAPWSAYQSPIDGEVIDSRAKRNEHMARHGVVMYDDVKPDFERNRKRIAAEAAAERKKDLIEGMHKVEAGYKPVLEYSIIPE
jgi:hypothetical protein